MYIDQSPLFLALTFVAFFPHFSSSLGLACDQAVVDGITWDLSMLGGPRSVIHSVDEVVSLKSTTYTIDVCQGLILKERNIAEKLCPFGARVCAMERIVSGNTSILERGWPIAGELKEHSGGYLDEKWERLKKSSSSSAPNVEGLKLEMNGGFFIRDDGKKRSQKAVVNFLCDHTRIGTENLLSPEDEYLQPKSKMNTEWTGSSGNILKSNEDGADLTASSLTFVEYNQDNKDFDTLILSWRTKFACQDIRDERHSRGTHWGFFTWLVLIVFLSMILYFIYMSWLNYSRDGARGCDLLPHSDTIQDIPYLVKDWTRRVLNTIQGGGSRSGYAAV
ncbi:Autophagy-related protein 27 [Golovinomyces cichoracearum]|uniref:Autophagy-related protein 27 n=1 Tax=Golovinomyces cichoracearum TaxID=62708 RepID=A0A420JBE2_9PEZI|nr:Autophagy-related protein 27 [Golovinomyces cichoracearum]